MSEFKNDFPALGEE